MSWSRTSEPRGEMPLDRPRSRGRRGTDGSAFRDRFVIAMTAIGVALFLVLGIPLLKEKEEVSGARPAAESTSKRELPSTIESTRVPAGDSERDADRAAVRQWLAAHGDDPHPREIRWWPVRELRELYQRQIQAAREAAEDDPQLDDLVSELEQQGPDRVCRLKYRTHDATGAHVSRDELFTVRGGKVARIRANSSLATAARRYFDGDGDP